MNREITRNKRIHIFRHNSSSFGIISSVLQGFHNERVEEHRISLALFLPEGYSVFLYTDKSFTRFLGTTIYEICTSSVLELESL